MVVRPCGECGFDWDVDAAVAARMIGGAPEALTWAATDDDALRRRPTPASWSVVEYTAHVAEALRWYAGRLERVMGEDSPQLDPFDFDAACRDGGYNQRPLAAVQAEVADAASDMVALMARMTAAGWRRVGVGSDGTARPAWSLATRAAHEVVHHAFDVERTVLLVTEGGANDG
jgi:hypothetical protein